MASVLAETYYNLDQLVPLDLTRIPRHIAIVMDGNRRWAKKSAHKVSEGHRCGADILIDIIKAAKELGVKVMTLYVFSTENWDRPEEEVAALMLLFESYIRAKIPTMLENGMHFDTIGELSRFPQGVKEAIDQAKAATAECSDIQVIFAMNYGARDEMKRAVQNMLRDYALNKLSIEKVTEETISSYLDTGAYPDPDLLIRTGGEQRISNYLLWQSSYAEFYFTDLFWPEFTPEALLEAVLDFQSRERRLGI